MALVRGSWTILDSRGFPNYSPQTTPPTKATAGDRISRHDHISEVKPSLPAGTVLSIEEDGLSAFATIVRNGSGTFCNIQTVATCEDDLDDTVDRITRAAEKLYCEVAAVTPRPLNQFRFPEGIVTRWARIKYLWNWIMNGD